MGYFYCKRNGEWIEQSAKALYRKENGKWEMREWSELAPLNYLAKTLEGKVRYVSLGDSIAVGHRIDEKWETNYGWDAQYGVNGRNETTIVPGCYTDLIRNELMATYGSNRVLLKSFARSGDTVADLMEKLNHDTVKNAISIADIVTICIGANDVLHPVLMQLEAYINTGDLSSIINTVEANLAVLANDSHAASYRALFNKLKSINPNAKYVFTTIYNPYKYLWIEEGEDGFFRPILNSIPQMTIANVIEVDELIKDGLLSTPAVRTLFSRVNGLCDYAENFVTKLNTVLRSKIAAYGDAHFLLADTKAVFDPVPDRIITAPKHYNDLVNVEYTRGYDTAKMDWGRLWTGSSIYDFWFNMALKHTSISGINVRFDINGFASDLVQQMVEKVIEPDVDPHPEWYGHQALKCAFADALGWSALPRRTITYYANGGSGAMASGTVVALDNLTAYTKIRANGFTPATGYYFTGWNTASDGSGTAYSADQLVGLTGNLSLYAQWDNHYTVTFRHSYDSKGTHGSGDTGPMDCYALWIDGKEQTDLGPFYNSARTYRLPYGTPLGVIAAVERGSDRSYVTWNGAKVSGNANRATYDFMLTSDVDIHFEWNWFLGDVSQFFATQSYWNCYITAE